MMPIVDTFLPFFHDAQILVSFSLHILSIYFFTLSYFNVLISHHRNVRVDSNHSTQISFWSRTNIQKKIPHRGVHVCPCFTFLPVSLFIDSVLSCISDPLSSSSFSLRFNNLVDIPIILVILNTIIMTFPVTRSSIFRSSLLPLILLERSTKDVSYLLLISDHRILSFDPLKFLHLSRYFLLLLQMGCSLRLVLWGGVIEISIP